MCLADARSATRIVFPKYLTYLPGYGVSFCNYMVEFVFPENVKSISNYFFYGCISLKEIVIPDTVTTIDFRAFWECTSLTRITIPASVTKIDSTAFDGCKKDQIGVGGYAAVRMRKSYAKKNYYHYTYASETLLGDCPAQSPFFASSIP